MSIAIKTVVNPKTHVDEVIVTYCKGSHDFLMMSLINSLQSRVLDTMVVIN